MNPNKMGKAPETVLTLDVWLWPVDDDGTVDHDGDPELHEVVTGAAERIETRRARKMSLQQIIEEGDEESLAYMAWSGLKRRQRFKGDFDTFVDRLAEVGVEDDDEDEGEGGDAAGR